jgi:Protein of unknown function (DUF3551)
LSAAASLPAQRVFMLRHCSKRATAILPNLPISWRAADTSAAGTWPARGELEMRIGVVAGSTAIALLALIASAAPSQAYVPQPWCSDGTGNESGAPDCAYSSYQQCVANAGECVANPALSPLPTTPGSTDFEVGHYRY